MSGIQKILIVLFVLVLLWLYFMNAIQIKVSNTVLPQLNAFNQTISLPIEVNSLLPFSVPIKFNELKVSKTDGTILINSTATSNASLNYAINTGSTVLLIPFKIDSLSFKNIPLSQWLTGVELDIVGIIEVTVIFKFTINLKQRIKL